MPLTLVGFSEAVDSAVLRAHAALPDPHVRVVGTDIYVPGALPNLAGIYCVGAAITQGQVAAPSIRRKANIDVAPFERAATPAVPPRLHELFTAPYPLEGAEAINVLMAEDGAGAQRQSALLWFSDGPVSPVTGEIFTLRCTSATTLAVYAWTNGALTFSQTLPRGTYQIVGMHAQSTGLLAARLVVPGFSWRPGVIGATTLGNPSDGCFRRGKIGVFAEFAHDAPPTVDFLSTSADTAEVVHLDLIKLA